MGEAGKLVYLENPDKLHGDNIEFGEIAGVGNPMWHFNADGVRTDLFDGIQLVITRRTLLARMSAERSGWIKGRSPISVVASPNESRFFPWKYEIVFSDSLHTSRTSSTVQITGVEGTPLTGPSLLLGQSFNFAVINKSFQNANGEDERLDLVVQDVNINRMFEPRTDYVLAGHTVMAGTNVRWAGTVLVIDFHDVEDESSMPQVGDVYRVSFERPFVERDSVLFKMTPEVEQLTEQITAEAMSGIKVVPNPYVATNTMEPSLSNPFLNQRRRLLFTHIPAQCSIKIFTSSGVFVDEIEVNNPAPNGTVHWDMLTKEGLEIAAGIYVYHVQARQTTEVKIGKFAVIK